MENNTINIDGTEYNPKDLNEDQNYLIAQIKDLQAKSANLRFQLDQITVAQNSFTNELITSVANKEVSQLMNEARK